MGPVDALEDSSKLKAGAVRADRNSAEGGGAGDKASGSSSEKELADIG
jgi:hypothetical protein